MSRHWWFFRLGHARPMPTYSGLAKTIFSDCSNFCVFNILLEILLKKLPKIKVRDLVDAHRQPATIFYKIKHKTVRFLFFVRTFFQSFLKPQSIYICTHTMNINAFTYVLRMYICLEVVLIGFELSIL
jgi:hypothetical protein